MKAYLRLMREVRPGIKLPTFDHEQSAETYRRLPVLNRHLPTQYQLSPKTYKRIPLLLFILVFVSCGAAMAQESVVHTTPAAKAETEITPLKIGDKIPDELWEMYFPVVSANSDEVQYLSLGEFKDKLIILDFWATWCGSCYKGLTDLNQWQKDFEKDLLVVPVSYQGSDEIKKVLINKDWEFSSVFNDELLKEYFPHKFLPHQVIISKGKITAISSGSQLDEDKILTMIKGDDVNFRVKNDIIDFDKNAILLQNSDPRFRNKLVYGSSFFEHIDGLGSTVGFSTADGYNRLFFNNQRIIDMYFAVIDPSMRNRIFFEVRDLARINHDKNDVNLDSEEWRSNNTYSYELVLPQNININELYHFALNDFDRHFDLDTKMVEREMDCYVIVNQNGKQFIDPFKDKLPNESELFLTFETLLQYLNSQIADFARRPIFINESNIDISTSILITKGKFKAPDELQRILSNYGLELKNVKRYVKVFVIKDKS